MQITVEEIKALLDLALRSPLSSAETLWAQAIGQRVNEFLTKQAAPQPENEPSESTA